MSPSERREMIRKDHTDLSLTRQCKLLKISRSSIYYTPVGFDQATIDLMHEIDQIFTKYPFAGSRQIAAYLLSGFSQDGTAWSFNGHHGASCHLQRPKHEQEAPPTQDLAVFMRKVNHAAQSRLVQRHYIHSSEERLPVSGGNNGLGDPQSIVLAAVKHARCQLLC